MRVGIALTMMKGSFNMLKCLIFIVVTCMGLSMVFLFLFYRSLFFSVEAIFGQSTPPNKRGVEFDQDIITNSTYEIDMMYPLESNKNFAL